MEGQACLDFNLKVQCYTFERKIDLIIPFSWHSFQIFNFFQKNFKKNFQKISKLLISKQTKPPKTTKKIKIQNFIFGHFFAFFRSTFRLRGPEKMGFGQNFQEISKVLIFRHVKPLKNQIKKISPEKSC